MNKNGVNTQRALIPFRLCSHCGEGINLNEGYTRSHVLHKQCRIDKYHPLLICFTCGKEFRRSATELRARTPERGYRTSKNFCSHVCYGSYAGNTFGFGKENPKRKAETLIDGASIIFRMGKHESHEGTILKMYRVPEGKKFDVSCNECNMNVGTKVWQSTIRAKK